MTCECGCADECDGEHGTLYPLQDGGMCSVFTCKMAGSATRDDAVGELIQRELRTRNPTTDN